MDQNVSLENLRFVEPSLLVRLAMYVFMLAIVCLVLPGGTQKVTDEGSL